MNDDIDSVNPLDLTDDDLNKLGLREHPFLDHADESFLYTDSQLEMTTNIIMEYLTNPATSIVLTGELGLGKTTFLRKVLRLGYQQYQFCTLRATTETDFNFIENKIKQRWVLNETNEHSSVADLSIENYVITYLREHTHAVLIIDDAHLLDETTLDRLFTLKHRIGLACPMSLGFILAGETSLKSTIADLEDSNPACTQVYQINIRPFSHEQTKNYIEHRLAVAGFEGDVLFDDVKITEIYKATSGNAKQIHEQAILTLHNQCYEDTLEDELNPHITIRQPKPKIPVLFFTLLAILGIGLYVNYQISEEGTEETIHLEKPLSSEPTLSPIAQEADTPEDQQTPSLPLPKTPISDDTQLDVSNLHDIELTEDKEETVKQDLPSLLAESIESLDETQLAGLKETLTEKVQQVESTDGVEEGSKPNAETTITEKNVEQGKQANNASQTAPTHGPAWLKELNSSNYTLQVVATRERKQLEALIKKENLTSEYAYFSKPVKSDTYYVLVIGDYKNRDAAIAASNKLSASLRKNKPWPVPVKNVQQFVK